MISRHRVAFVGGGFGGLFAAQALRQADVEVTSSTGPPITCSSRPLYQVATGTCPRARSRRQSARFSGASRTPPCSLAMRGRIFDAFELAEHESDPVARHRWLTSVVVGAGPTGVELAGPLAELSGRSLQRNFRRIDPADTRVLLLDVGPAILPHFPRYSEHRRADARLAHRIGVRVAGEHWHPALVEQLTVLE